MVSPMAWALEQPIRAYRRFISPLVPPRCKYYPTCSTYAVDVLRTHGAMKGTVLTLWRLARCNPWSMGGVDLPPNKGEWRPAPCRRMSDEELAQYWRKLDQSTDTDERRAA